jgi:hypothetical protein
MIKNVLYICLFSLMVLHQTKSQTFPKLVGRIAVSADGNLHDSDDWGATPLALAIIKASGNESALVHYDYNNHFGTSRKSWELKMDTSAKEGAIRFGLDVSKFFNCQTEKQKAIENFVSEVKKSSATNPLWLIIGGPMQMIHEMLRECPSDKRKFITMISHSTWNEDHFHKENKYTLDSVQLYFPEVKFHRIKDQNKSNGDYDLNSPVSNWTWLKKDGNKNLNWLFDRDDTHEVDELEKWKSETKENFDVSDAGMTYWLVTGGFNGGIDTAGWREMKSLLVDNRLLGSSNKFKDSKKNIDKDAIIKIEMESTKSMLGEWKKMKAKDKHYIVGASKKGFLEFQGNEPDSGDPNSPLTFKFKVKKDGQYRLLMMTSKRLEGNRGDMCNDAWVKMNGDFQSATTLSKEELNGYIKYFQEGSTKTPEKKWSWANRGEIGRHKFHNLIYDFKKGQTYELTIAGRSKNFSIDYFLLYDVNKVDESQAKSFGEN